MRVLADEEPAQAAERIDEGAAGTVAPVPKSLPRVARALQDEPSAQAVSDAQDAVQAASPEEPPPPDDGVPLHVHSETTIEGQAVWIAMRADDQSLATVLPQMVADIQRGLLARGQDLHQVVCNGRAVWRDGSWLPMEDARIPGAEGCGGVFNLLLPRGT